MLILKVTFSYSHIYKSSLTKLTTGKFQIQNYTMTDDCSPDEYLQCKPRSKVKIVRMLNVKLF